MERINKEKDRRVTAKVVGVLKKMNKTYGGSILNFKDMTPPTKNKYEQFTKNLSLD